MQKNGVLKWLLDKSNCRKRAGYISKSFFQSVACVLSKPIYETKAVISVSGWADVQRSRLNAQKLTQWEVSARWDFPMGPSGSVVCLHR